MHAEAASAITPRRLREYLGREFASDLRERRFSIVLEAGGRCEPVEPLRPRGVAILSEVLPLEVWGNVLVDVRILSSETSVSGVSLYGRGGLQVCSLAAVNGRGGRAWVDGRLEGSMRCDRFKLTADKTAVVQDQVYSQFILALSVAGPRLSKAMALVASDHMEKRMAQVTRRVNALVDRFLRHLQEGSPLRRAGSGATNLYGLEPLTQDVPPAPCGDVRSAGQRKEPLHFRLGQPDPVQGD